MVFVFVDWNRLNKARKLEVHLTGNNYLTVFPKSYDAHFSFFNHPAIFKALYFKMDLHPPFFYLHYSTSILLPPSLYFNPSTSILLPPSFYLHPYTSIHISPSFYHHLYTYILQPLFFYFLLFLLQKEIYLVSTIFMVFKIWKFTQPRIIRMQIILNIFQIFNKIVWIF